MDALRPRPPERRSRTRGALGLFGALLATAVVLALPVAGASFTVQAQNYAFVAPGGGSRLTVPAGSTVTWAASGDPHTVTSGAPGSVDNRFTDHPASAGLLVSGDSFTTTFSSLGTFPYFCEVHPEQMSGVITVVSTATGPPPPTPRATPPRATPPRATPRPTPAPTPSPSVPTAPTPSPTPSPLATLPSAEPSRSPTSPSPTAEPTPSPGPAGTDGAPMDAVGGLLAPAGAGLVIIVGLGWLLWRRIRSRTG